MIPLPEVSAELARTYGPDIEVHPNFPRRTNVQFLQVLDRAFARNLAEVQPVLTTAALAQAQLALDQVHMDDRLKDYCVNLVRATRDPKGAGIASLAGLIEIPASPRATIYLAAAAI